MDNILLEAITKAIESLEKRIGALEKSVKEIIDERA